MGTDMYLSALARTFLHRPNIFHILYPWNISYYLTYDIWRSTYDKQNPSVSTKKQRIAIKEYNIIHTTLLKAFMEYKH